ncbi:uncharacterized protein BDZ99DRAFT_501754 [Mytilinidion resinicola]|uniref:Uncharacterized protein n=1 Tax=Mytilinidion resinicola TaxID=574789 RepID=A0A6A6YAA3_9PEZI|nr:uncharacterized protein BDZ99DRAFT_501754 [Mytilinidion resinicola]KAF2805549.1 hypothetical protein BDZ99DRAFT_501754 [Mytilinidion resinicola]
MARLGFLICAMSFLIGHQLKSSMVHGWKIDRKVVECCFLAPNLLVLGSAPALVRSGPAYSSSKPLQPTPTRRISLPPHFDATDGSLCARDPEPDASEGRSTVRMPGLSCGVYIKLHLSSAAIDNDCLERTDRYVLDYFYEDIVFVADFVKFDNEIGELEERIYAAEGPTRAEINR